MYKKEKFYGCEKLYFTELFYERKRKARARKENFTIAPLQSCFVTVSVFVGTSVGSLHIKRSRPGSEYVQPPPPSPPSRSEWPFHRTHLFLQSQTSGSAGAEDSSEEPLLAAAPLRPVSSSCVSMEINGHEAGYFSAATVFLSPLAAKRPFSIRHPNTTGLHHWFYWTASPRNALLIGKWSLWIKFGTKRNHVVVAVVCWFYTSFVNLLQGIVLVTILTADTEIKVHSLL